MYLQRPLGRLVDAASGQGWSPLESRTQALRRASVYQVRGVASGDRVLLQLGNCREFFADLLALWTLGAVAVPVDRRLTPFEFQRLVQATGAQYTVVDDATDEKTVAHAGVTPIHTREAGKGASDDLPVTTPVRLDDDALILFTSGSTGAPKGVLYSHRSLLARWVTLQGVLGLGAYERTLCVLPTNFGHGLICNCLFPWLAGCDLYIAPAFKPEIIMRLGQVIDEHGITFLSSVPSLWNLALRIASPPAARSLRRIHVGSAPLSAAQWSRIKEWGRIREVFNAYGITETGSWTAGTTSGDVTPEDGLIGEPWGATARICDARTPGEFLLSHECKPNEEGMLWVNTPALMKGYYQRADLTDAVVSNGWFMTGDIGVRDTRGRLFLKGRERDEINKGGFKVYPADIDSVAQEHPAVADACTFGIEDPAYGENVAIAVVLAGERGQSVRSLHEWIHTRLAEYKQPVRWYVLDEIPRNERGKIDRRTVKRICDGREPVDVGAALRGGGSGAPLP